MSEEGTRSPESGGLLRRALSWWALTGVFLLGLIVGAVCIALVAGSTPAPAASGAAGTSAPDEGDGGSPAGVTGQLVVNAACLRAVNAAQDTADVVDDLGEAVAEFNAARLDEVVRQLQPLQQRLEENIEECEVVGQVPSEAPGEETTSESESPSTVSPTD